MPTISARELTPASTPTGAVAPVEATRQTTPNEVPPTPEATKSEEKTSPQLAVLARKERALRAEFQKLKAEQEAFKAKQTEYETSYIPKAKLTERAKQDALGILTDLGITPDEFTQQLLNSSPQDHYVKKLEAKIQALEDAQNKTVSKIDEQQTQAYQQALKQIGNEAKLLIDSNPEFETIKARGEQQSVVDLIEEVFNKGWEDKDLPAGHLLSIEEAAKYIEDHLFEEALKLTQISKIKARMAQTPEAPAPEEKKQHTITEKQPMKTLTNAVSASSKPLGKKERRERAILAFQGKL